MKPINSLLRILAVLPIFFISSCEQHPEVTQEGTLELGVALDQLDGQLKSALADSGAVRAIAVVISVANENGELVLDHERLELYNFGGHWITKEIRLKAGHYQVMKFLVVDWQGMVFLATPVEGSTMAYLVDNPLPFPFNIKKDEIRDFAKDILKFLP